VSGYSERSPATDAAGSAGVRAGTRLAAYRVLRLLARGGMGVVYEAEHAEFGRVALKTVEPSLTGTSAWPRFLREARALQRVQHPHVVRVFEAVFDEQPFIAMELLEGETLASSIAREGALPLSRLVALFAPILSAVAGIHAAGVLHRDLKLGNVMLAQRNGGDEPILLDFGISRLVDDPADEISLTHSEAVLGTPRYLSPEQTLNAKAASPLSDQYALGVMLYETATGERPFSGASTYEVMHAILNRPLAAPSQLAPELPPEFDAIVLRAMNRDPSQRFASVAALRSALLACNGLDDGDRTEFDAARAASETMPARASRRAEREGRSLAWLRHVGLSVSTILVGFACLAFLQKDRGAPTAPSSPAIGRRTLENARPDDAPKRATPEPSPPPRSTPAAVDRPSTDAAGEPKASSSPTKHAPARSAAGSQARTRRMRDRDALKRLPGRDDVVDPFALP
jgi:eukaryotic-like serine/threonine-protein kinase